MVFKPRATEQICTIFHTNAQRAAQYAAHSTFHRGGSRLLDSSSA